MKTNIYSFMVLLFFVSSFISQFPIFGSNDGDLSKNSHGKSNATNIGRTESISTLNGMTSQAQPKVTINKIYTMTAGNKYHATTRSTIDLVHHLDGIWFAFHGASIDPCCGHNCFQTSQDGKNWSDIKTGTNSTTEELGRSFLIEGKKITKLFTKDLDPDPDVWNMELYIGEGTISGDDIQWDSPQILIPCDSINSWAYYNDLKEQRRKCAEKMYLFEKNFLVTKSGFSADNSSDKIVEPDTSLHICKHFMRISEPKSGALFKADESEIKTLNKYNINEYKNIIENKIKSL